MKSKILLFCLFLGACYGGFDYYWNPYKVLSLAQQGIKDLDVNSMMDATAEHALCTYASKEGLSHLRKIAKGKEVTGSLERIHGNQAGTREYFIAKIRSQSTDKLLAKAMIQCNHEDKAHWCSITAIKVVAGENRRISYCEDLDDFNEILNKLRKI